MFGKESNASFNRFFFFLLLQLLLQLENLVINDLRLTREKVFIILLVMLFRWWLWWCMFWN